jgi:ribosomal protein S18 acetylase RimI-like enzyme
MLRKATRADYPRIAEIRFAVRENLPSNPAAIEALSDWLFDNSPFWVWEADGAIQGFSAADPRDGSICALFVHPAYEGRGIGRALLPPACDILKASGHAMAVLTTEAATRAERFYRADGWTEVGRKEDGQIIFQKSLSGACSADEAEMVQIRKAALEDIAAIARVHVQTDWDTYSALFGSKAYALESGESEYRWRRALQDGDALFVASDGDGIIGLGHARGDRIDALYLLPSYQRRGIGRALLSRLLADLHNRGIAEATLDVVAANVNAIKFYRALGAYPVGRRINRDARGDADDIVFAIRTAPGDVP